MTDFYGECEAGLAALLKTLTAYFPRDWQVSDDDTAVMQGAEYVVVYRPGAFPLIRQTDQLSTVSWAVTLDLYIQYTDYKTSWAKFKTFRSDLFNLLMAHPTLNDTAGVFRVDLSSDRPTQYLKFTNEPQALPNYIVQSVRVVITQYIQYSDGEF